MILNTFSSIHPKKINSLKLKQKHTVNYQSVTYEFSDLFEWRNKIREVAIKIKGLSFLDIDEVKNRIVISTENLGSDTIIIESLLDDLNIPVDAVIIEEKEKMDITLESMPTCDKLKGTEDVDLECGGGGAGSGGSSNLTLQSQHSTFVGGRQIIGPRNNACTLGLNIAWGINNSQRGFVTASHCTDEMAKTDYGYFNHGNTTLGREEFDRESWDNIFGDSYCKNDYKCRYSDVALIEYPTYMFQQAPVGVIASPGLNSIILGSNSDLYGFYVYDTINWPSTYMDVHKVGSNTGLTTGNILKTCADAYATIGDVNYMFICVVNADYDSAPGDSGAPVITNSNYSTGYSIYDFEVMLAGFHLGGNKSNNYAVFSSVYYTIGEINNCRYYPGSSWLWSELCNEASGFGPYEIRNEVYR